MGNSETPWINATYDWAVYALDDLGDLLGMSYELVNIVVFMGIGPALVGFLIGWVLLLRRKLREAERDMVKIWESLYWDRVEGKPPPAFVQE